MALNIRNPEAERLAEDLAALTGETKTEAVKKALADRLALLQRRGHRGKASVEELLAIANRAFAIAKSDLRIAAVRRVMR